MAVPRAPIQMQMVVWPKTAEPWLATLSSLMEGSSRGCPAVDPPPPSPPPKASTSPQLTQCKSPLLWSFIGELFGPLAKPTTLFSDNQSTIALTKNYQFHARTKHTDVHFHFIRWVVENDKLRLIYCPTADMIADTLTKALPLLKVEHFTVELGPRST